jgi:hypothetical protein
MYILSHGGINAAKSCWRRRCQDNLAAVRCRYRVVLETMLPSHVGNGAAEVTWVRHDIDAESR